MRQRYERQIEQIKQENKSAINGLLEEFKVNLRKVHVEYKESESFAAKLKDYYQKKLEKQEQTHDEEVLDLKLQHHDEDESKRKEVDEKTHEREEKRRLKIQAEDKKKGI